MNEQELNELGAQQRRMLEIVWQRNGATVHEVLAEMNKTSETPLAYTTVLCTMQKLEKAGWVTHDPVSGSNRRYVYKATQSRSSAIGNALRKFADTFLGGSKTLLFQHFVDDAGLSDEELEEIIKIADGRRQAAAEE